MDTGEKEMHPLEVQQVIHLRAIILMGMACKIHYNL